MIKKQLFKQRWQRYGRIGFILLAILFVLWGAAPLTQAAPPQPDASTVRAGQVPDGLTAAEWESIQAQIAAGQPNRDTANQASRLAALSSGQQAKLAAKSVANDYLGWSVAVSGDIAVIGAYGNDDGGTSSGAAYVFTRSGSTWSQQAKLTASDAAAGDRFGYTVAVNGETAVIGAYGNDDGGTNSGSAYIFIRSGTTWSEQAKLTASDAAAGDNFGISVAVSGNTAVIGAYLDDDGGTNSGAAYVFTRSGTTWNQQAKLTASDAAADDWFGYSVAVSGDTAVIGADGDDDGGNSSGAAYVFVRSGTTWSQQAKLTASDAAADDRFGASVAVDGDTAVIGAYRDDDGGADSGAAYVFIRSGTTWSQQAKLTASDAAADDQFGRSVAVDGDTAVIGAHRDDDSATNSGSAYVFTRSGTTWSQQAKLTASDAAANDYFGKSVAVDGNTAVIGAYGDDANGGTDSGSAYVFTRSGTAWSQQAKMTASDAAANDWFGYSVAVSGDTAVIGVPFDDNDSGTDSGSAYVFVRSGTTWNQQAKLTASDAAAGDNFGWSVAVSGDTAVIGANGDDDGGNSSGAAYVFVRNGTTWSQQAKLTANDAAANDWFGSSVAVDGNTAVIGAYYNDDGGTDSGSAYVFTRSGTVWSQQAKLTASDAAAGDNFGVSVAVDGDTAVIGAYRDDDNGANSGSAYVFTRSSATWSQQAKLTAGDAAANDRFGYSVAVNGDTAVIGAVWDDDGGTDSGAAYVFTRSGTVWSQQAKLTASDAAVDDWFGYSVAVSGDTAVIGAYRDDDNGANSGSAYVFTRSSATWSQQAKLTASDAAAEDNFGRSVAVDGDTAVIGAYQDDDGGTDSGSAYVFTGVSNQPPVADAGASQTVNPGDTVTLDGSGSSDPNGDALTYLWQQTGGTAVTLSSTSAANPTFTAPNPAGVLTFTLTVTDTSGLMDAAATTVTISNQPPTADAGAPQTVNPGDTVTLDGIGSSDPNGDVLTYLWQQTGGTAVTLSSPTAVNPAFTAPGAAGVLTFTLAVTDSLGLASAPDTVTITVKDYLIYLPVVMKP